MVMCSCLKKIALWQTFLKSYKRDKIEIKLTAPLSRSLQSIPSLLWRLPTNEVLINRHQLIHTSFVGSLNCSLTRRSGGCLSNSPLWVSSGLLFNKPLGHWESKQVRNIYPFRLGGPLSQVSSPGGVSFGFVVRLQVAERKVTAVFQPSARFMCQLWYCHCPTAKERERERESWNGGQ